MRSTLLTTAIVVAASLHCRPSPPERPEAPPRAASSAIAATAALAELATPASLDDEALAVEVGRFVERVELDELPAAPAVGDPGALIVAPESDVDLAEASRLSTQMFKHEPGEGEVGEEVRFHFRLLRRRPWVTLAPDGAATIAFETVRPVPGATLYYGMDVREEIVSVPRYRRATVGAERRGEGLVYHVAASVPSVLRERYDVAGARDSGRGVMHFRLALFDTATQATRTYDGEVAFRCEGGRCVEGAAYVQTPTFRLGPVVDLVGPTGATISFTTDAATAAAVLVIDAAGARRLLRDEALGTRHEISVEGLAPRQRYRYVALAVDRRGEVSMSRGATFRTAPEAGSGEPLRFVVMSDGRGGVGNGDVAQAGGNREVIHDLLGRALEARPELVLFVGDLVDGGGTEAEDMRFQLESWVRMTEPFAAFLPIYEAMGNHEPVFRTWDSGWGLGRSGAESGEAVFADLFVNPRNGPEPRREGAPPYLETVYGFDVGAVHVAVVNSNYWFRSHPDRRDHPAVTLGQREGTIDDETLEWLAADLAAARERGCRHLFVATHEPAFPCGGHAHDGMYWRGEVPEVLARRDRFLRLLARHGVEALFTGDEHNYSRLLIDETLVEGLERPLWQIITGSAGAPYYTQDRSVPWASQVRAFDVRFHMVVVTVEGEAARAEAIARSGALIDEVELGGRS